MRADDGACAEEEVVLAAQPFKLKRAARLSRFGKYANWMVRMKQGHAKSAVEEYAGHSNACHFGWM